MATTLSAQISALATQIGSDIKTLIAHDGDLSALTTQQKASLVLALNELKAGLTAVEGKLGAQIDDSSSGTDKTWSASKINSAITSAVNALINGAPETLDTIKEVADAITATKDAISAIQAVAAGHVKYDGAQDLTSEQKTQARTNIGAAGTADVEAVKTTIGTMTNLSTTDKTSIVGAINEVKGTADTAKSTADTANATATAAQTKANQVETALNTLTTNVGDTQADFVAVYEAARDGSAA
jgi:hypothetical protein